MNLPKILACRCAGLLANINPTSSWVRLAQRILVRIELVHVSPDVQLIAGLTATVEIQPRTADSRTASRGSSPSAEPEKLAP
jgi:multidrug resistance efflux pump